MPLIWTRIGPEVLIGERELPLSVGESLKSLINPMTLQYVNMPQPSQIHRGKPPEMITGFRLAPIPCSEIFLNQVSYAGVIHNHDPVYVTYYKVLESVKE